MGPPELVVFALPVGSKDPLLLPIRLLPMGAWRLRQEPRAGLSLRELLSAASAPRSTASMPLTFSQPWNFLFISLSRSEGHNQMVGVSQLEKVRALELFF